jgi:malate/lactate dehydrogenase
VVSAAKAIMDHVVDWREGSSNVVTMGVITTEAVYGLGVGICISLPTECLGGYTFRIKKDFSLCQSQIESLKKSE